MTSAAKNNNVAYKQFFLCLRKESHMCVSAGFGEASKEKGNSYRPQPKPPSTRTGSCGSFQGCWQYWGRFVFTKIRTVSDSGQRHYFGSNSVLSLSLCNHAALACEGRAVKYLLVTSPNTNLSIFFKILSGSAP